MSQCIVNVDKITGYVHAYDNEIIAGAGKLNENELNVLYALHNANGLTVERNTLLEIGWPGRVVGPNSLNMAINKIRKCIALAANDEDTIFIFTVPRQGFKLIPGVISFVNERELILQEVIQGGIVKEDSSKAVENYEKPKKKAYLKACIEKLKLKISVSLVVLFSVFSLSSVAVLGIYWSDVDLYCHLENGRWMCGLDKNKCNEKKSNREVAELKGDVYVYGEDCTIEKSVKVSGGNN
ncbi:winged helix-turn-helix domain-containing protein [Aeromonas salmonicida]|uniref:winged helix-turn-helix domain-containing protein n=1 Tax=Aeromonas salmonicida TaxID=645 RepID=UPI00232F6F64|nr:winged helix-turn-helix domain-containing protein [Aeromonas salmonicida]WCH23588.1 winged helix-turn-helix domain-containing protein [Aeromonas salmonicida]